MSRSMAPIVKRVAGVWLAWTVAGIFYITQDTLPRLYRNEPVSWSSMFTGWMAAMYICAALTPLMLWLGRRWPLDHERRWMHAALHLGFGAIFSIVSATIEAPVLLALGVFPGTPSSLWAGASLLIAYGFHGGIIRYWAVIGLQAVIRSRQKAQAREREALELRIRSSELAGQLTTAQLSALKMQLQPHFLFNTLGAIMVLVQQQKGREAETMLARLGDLLRLAVDEVETQEVPLWRELDFLGHYLSIEQVRFQDRLHVRIAADPETTDALVPHMILQPLVENAIRHGLGQSEEAVAIEVTASRHDGKMVLIVSDDGPGSSGSPGRNEPGFGHRGVGLTNTENRLRGLYGATATLIAENRRPRGARVTIALPFHTDPSTELRAGRSEDAACR